MKKLLTSVVAVLLVLCMVLPMASCGKKIKTEVFEGDFTYKDAVGQLATNWNPHTYQTNDDAYPADFIRAGLYTFVFNDELHPVDGKDPYSGYKIIPEMAASEPVDVTEQVKKDHPEFGIPESVTSGYAYTIDLNKNACWQDGTKIDADTYVYSMQMLLDSKLLNYRASDYYTQSLCIAGAENYANSGRTVKKENSSDGEALDYEFSALVKGADGNYTTADGKAAYFGLKTAYAWMGGSNSLADYAGAGYVAAADWKTLNDAADSEGYAPVNDATIAALYNFTGSDTWGNETKDQLGYYVSYDKVYDVVSYDTVGLYKTGEYQITLVLAKALAGFNLLYNLSSNWIVYKDLYEANLKQDGDAWTSTYNTSVETTMSYGPYKLVSYQADKSMRFEKNETWYGWTDDVHVYVDPEDGKTYRMYQTTAIDTQVVAEADTQKMMFLKGELMTYGLQADDFDQYRSSEYCYATPQETIYFMIFNGYKDVLDNREAAADFDTAKYDLQTMSLTSFRKAVALTYDKELFASTISPARSGGYGLIGTAYIYDPDTGARYRDTDQAKKALCAFYNVDISKFASLDEAVDSITGYDPVSAKEFYKEAFDEAVKAGYITDKDNDGKADQTVRIEYCASVINSFMEKTVDYLNQKMAEVTVGTPFEGKIEFYLSAPYGNDWSDKIKSGLSDIVLGGWSGSALDPFGLSDLYVNPSRQYDAKWFNAAGVDLTLTVDVAKVGAPADMKEVTMNLKQWSDALNGETVTVNGVDYNFGEGIAEISTRLDILAAIETRVLQTYDYIPMLQNGSMSLLSQQVYYVVEEYNPIMGRGGIAYLKYNYNDAEWTAFVSSQPNGELKY